MFRTSNNRGQKRFDDLRFSDYKKNARVSLTKKQIQLIEESTFLSLGGKIELFLVALGNKLTTEIYMDISYHHDKKTKLDEPQKIDLEKIEKLLQQLPFQYYLDSLPKFNKATGHTENFHWFQVSVNEAVSHFMKEYPDDLTEFEEGVLYGFPLSAIRAFARLVEDKHGHPNPPTYFLAGWCSREFWEDEQMYYSLWWKRLKQMSPRIVQEAEQDFFQIAKNQPKSSL